MDEMGAAERRVLVVDDSPLVRKLIACRLRKAGYRVAEAADGREALDHFQKQGSAVVITDLNMPHLDGLSLLAALRQYVSPPEVILLTGSCASHAEAAVQALRLGAHDYIAKDPTAGGAVVLAVQRASEKWRLREENGRLLTELRRLSLTDALTSVGNRRALDETLRLEIGRARRHARELALALVDLDRFKRVNDTLGHRAGDDVLRCFAQRAAALLRSSDRLYRYGGEEFAMLLPEQTERGGLEAAWRVVGATAAAPRCAGRQRVAVTCSAGVAALCARDDADGSELLARADAALHAAKRSGRNQARGFESSGVPEANQVVEPKQPAEMTARPC
jgi:diguanylate cyclase (GGDEF)-like protein